MREFKHRRGDCLRSIRLARYVPRHFCSRRALKPSHRYFLLKTTRLEPNITAETPNFRKCGEKSETAEHNAIFDNKTAGREERSKTASGRQISVFPRTSGIPKRKYAANSGTPRAHRSFRAKKPQVEALPTNRMVDKSQICRILPNMISCQGSGLIGIIQFTPRYI